MADELKAQMTQLEAAVAEYKLKHGKMPGEEPEPFSVRLQQDNLELIQQKRELRARIAALEADLAEWQKKAAAAAVVLHEKIHECDDLKTDCERLREDAERLEFVVGCSRPMGLDIDGLHYWQTMYPRNVRGPNLREAIDAARREQT